MIIDDFDNTRGDFAMKIEAFEYDKKRYGGVIPRYAKDLLKCYRILQSTANPLLKIIFRVRFMKLKAKHGIELYYGTKIERGLYIGHPFNITINAKSVIGENCNIHKGVLIGQENRGLRKGVPIIGNKVWIGINSVIVGAVHMVIPSMCWNNIVNIAFERSVRDFLLFIKLFPHLIHQIHYFSIFTLSNLVFKQQSIHIRILK